MEGFLKNSLKIKPALKSAGKWLSGIEKSLKISSALKNVRKWLLVLEMYLNFTILGKI